MTDSIETFAKALGLPGLIIAAWYLLERLRIERIAKVEEAKTAAMADGFRALSSQITTHQTADLQSHAEMAETLGEIRGRLDGGAQVRARPQLVNDKER